MWTDLFPNRPWWAVYLVALTSLTYLWCVVNLIVDYRRDGKEVKDGKP